MMTNTPLGNVAQAPLDLQLDATTFVGATTTQGNEVGGPEAAAGHIVTRFVCSWVCPTRYGCY